MNKKASLLDIQDRIIGILFILLGMVILFIGISAYSDTHGDDLNIDRSAYVVKDLLYQLSITPVTIQDETVLYSDALVEYVQLYRQSEKTTEEYDRQQELYTILSSAARTKSGNLFIIADLYDGDDRIERISLDRLSSYTPKLTEDNSIVLAYQTPQEKKYLLYLYADYDAKKLELQSGIPIGPKI